MTHVLSVVTHRNLYLAATLPSELARPLVASSFAIVPKFWRRSTDHASGSVTDSGSFPPASVPSLLRHGVPGDLLAKNQKVGSRQNNPPSCPPTGVFLVRKLNFIAKLFAL
jgi:hypothetical protein